MSEQIAFTHQGNIDYCHLHYLAPTWLLTRTWHPASRGLALASDGSHVQDVKIGSSPSSKQAGLKGGMLWGSGSLQWCYSWVQAFLFLPVCGAHLGVPSPQDCHHFRDVIRTRIWELIHLAGLEHGVVSETLCRLAAVPHWRVTGTVIHSCLNSITEYLLCQVLLARTVGLQQKIKQTKPLPLRHILVQDISSWDFFGPIWQTSGIFPSWALEFFNLMNIINFT